MSGISHIRIAQIVGITTSLALSGSIFTYSYGAMPAISLSPPSLACQQWKTMFSRGKIAARIFAPISVASYLWAWRQTDQVAYAVAAALTASIVPWTLATMMRTINSIETFSGTEDDSAALKKLLDKWSLTNYVRAVLPLVGGAVGLVTALS